MKKSKWRVALLMFLVPAAGLAAWTQSEHMHANQPVGDSNWSQLIGSMDKMHVAMSAVMPSDDDDTDFVKLMLPHHQAAIDMAKTELEYGKDPQMRRLAQEIITDQESEIELMQLWLKQRDGHTSKPGPKSDSGEGRSTR